MLSWTLTQVVSSQPDFLGSSKLDGIQQVFEQYTQHNIEHSRNVAEHMANILPAETLKSLNALDACRRKEAEAKYVYGDDAPRCYQPRIVVFDDSDDAENPRIELMDNGVGISRRVVEQVFPRVGKSCYKSWELEAKNADPAVLVSARRTGQSVAISTKAWSDRSGLRWRIEGLEPCAEVLDKAHVLLASEIDFCAMDTPVRLRGSTWFWLLKGGDQDVAPEQGYLTNLPAGQYEHSRWRLSLTGPVGWSSKCC